MLLEVNYAGLHSEPGSREWIITRRSLLVACLSDIKNNRTAGQSVYDEIKRIGGWQHLEDLTGRPFRSFEEFCASPNGLGIERPEIERRLTAPELAQSEKVLPVLSHSEAGAKGGRGKKASDKITSFRGTSAEYLVSRLKKHHPDIAARLAAGEFKSARAAARAAGLKVDDPPLKLLRRAWKRATADERAAFRAEIDE